MTVTLEEVQSSKKTMLSMKDISPIVGIHTSRLKEYAIDGQLANMIGGGVIVSGCRAKVSRVAFLNWYEGYMYRKGGPEHERQTE